MTVADWIAFGGLLVAIISGGVSALVWLLIRIGNLDKSFSVRFARIETILELAFPEAKQRAQVLDSSRRVGEKEQRRRWSVGL